MKKISSLIIILFISITSLFAKIQFFISANFDYCYDTNVFSSPLPSYDSGYWLSWREKNPFIIKHSIGTDLYLDMYFKEDTRTGFSTSLNLNFPLIATTITPKANTPEGYEGTWEYVHENAENSQHMSIFGSLGPTFRYKFNKCDTGIAIRLSLGTYNLENNDLVLGIQAEPFVNVFISNHIYLSTKFTYDAHFMRFLKHDKKIFDQNYIMISLAPSIGIGIKL